MFDTKPRTSLAALVFTDMVGSTAIKQRLGDHGSAEVFRRHHEIVRETLRRFPGGEEGRDGDSFLLAFATPSEAVQRLARRRAGAGLASRDRPGRAEHAVGART
jgi:class 3 adenylate cyclase